MNADVDLRHQRRPLSADEFSRLLSAARGGDMFHGLSAPDRAALYTVAGNGAGELDPGSFFLDGDLATVVVDAAREQQ